MELQALFRKVSLPRSRLLARIGERATSDITSGLPVIRERKGHAAWCTGQVDSIHLVDADTKAKTIASEKTTRTCKSVIAGIGKPAIRSRRVCYVKQIGLNPLLILCDLWVKMLRYSQSIAPAVALTLFSQSTTDSLLRPGFPRTVEPGHAFSQPARGKHWEAT